jgi:uncharacterized protein with HEPN domain
MKEDKVYLEHILEAIADIGVFLAEHTESDFYEQKILQSAVVRQLEVIGEASRQLSKEAKRSMKTIEWVSIIGMRNKLIHEYFGVDLQTVWLVVAEELPILKKEVKRYLEER